MCYLLLLLNFLRETETSDSLKGIVWLVKVENDGLDEEGWIEHREMKRCCYLYGFTHDHNISKRRFDNSVSADSIIPAYVQVAFGKTPSFCGTIKIYNLIFEKRLRSESANRLPETRGQKR